MKKTLTLTLIIFVFALNGKAQIPNAGFENWGNLGNYENPADWATMNSLSSGPFYSCTKSTEHYPSTVGNYSIRLQNNPSLTQLTGGYGMAITKAFNWPFTPSFPISGHPNSLTGYLKFDSQNGDTSYIKIILFKNGSIVSNNDLMFHVSIPVWIPFDIPFSSYTTADSATIMLSAFYPSYQGDQPNGSSVLCVDNLNFDTFISSVDETDITKPKISIYPNPASDNLYLAISSLNRGESTVNIYNTNGSLILSETLFSGKNHINTSSLSNGMYIVETITNGMAERQKLLIKK